MSIRIGFLLLDSAHHLYHALPIAVALSNLANMKVHLFTSTERNRRLIEQLLSDAYAGQHHCQITLLKPTHFYRLTRAWKRKPFPGLSAVLKPHLNTLRAYDGFVTPDRNLSILMKQAGFREKSYILINHGAGENAYGFQPDIDDYDFVLIYGQYFRQRLLNEKLLAADKMAVTGYPKFDWLKLPAPSHDSPLQTTANRLFTNDRPVVIYNPHFKRTLSSWFAIGMAILEWFYHHPEWNLIFAPHIMLAAKHELQLPAHFHDCQHMHIDVDSERLFDMTYLQHAQLYLGDVSSQVYEFVVEPRPCIFLNPSKHEWQADKNKGMWRLGQVISDVSELEAALSQALQNPSAYTETQRRCFNHMFDTTLGNDGKVAADAIAAFLER